MGHTHTFFNRTRTKIILHNDFMFASRLRCQIQIGSFAFAGELHTMIELFCEHNDRLTARLGTKTLAPPQCYPFSAQFRPALSTSLGHWRRLLKMQSMPPSGMTKSLYEVTLYASGRVHCSKEAQSRSTCKLQILSTIISGEMWWPSLIPLRRHFLVNHCAISGLSIHRCGASA